MIFAVTDASPRTEASPKARATCPCCAAPVKAKCGRIVSWHWAHESLEDCDPWAEPDSAWHRGWSALFPPDWTEVVVGRHRADAKRPDGLVVEFQHSSISPDEIREREEFYGSMIWVFDAVRAVERSNLSIRMPRERNGTSVETCLGWKDPVDERKAATGYRTFRWRWPHKTLGACRKPVFLDVGPEGLLSLRKIDVAAPCGGWGYLRERADFVRRLTVPRRAATA